MEASATREVLPITHSYFSCCLFLQAAPCSQQKGLGQSHTCCLHDWHNAHGNTFLFCPSFAAICGSEPHVFDLGQGRRLPAIPIQQLCQGGLEDLQFQQLGPGPHPFPLSSSLRMFLVPAVTLAVPKRKWRVVTPPCRLSKLCWPVV